MRKTSLPRWSTWTLAVSCSLTSRETLVQWWMSTSRELWAKPVASIQTLPFPRARQGWILCGEVRGAGTRSLWRGLLGLHCTNTHCITAEILLLCGSGKIPLKSPKNWGAAWVEWSEVLKGERAAKARKEQASPTPARGQSSRGFTNVCCEVGGFFF